jgi:hypothetical protein
LKNVKDGAPANPIAQLIGILLECYNVAQFGQEEELKRLAHPPFNAGNHDLTFRRIDIEKDAPVSDSPAEPFEASMEFADITLKRVLLHSFDRSIYAG